MCKLFSSFLLCILNINCVYVLNLYLIRISPSLSLLHWLWSANLLCHRHHYPDDGGCMTWPTNTFPSTFVVEEWSGDWLLWNRFSPQKLCEYENQWNEPTNPICSVPYTPPLDNLRTFFSNSSSSFFSSYVLNLHVNSHYLRIQPTVHPRCCCFSFRNSVFRTQSSSSSSPPRSNFF